MPQQRFRIKSIIYEAVNDDGTTEDVYLEDTRAGEEWGMGHIKFLSASPNADEKHHFWIASSHDGITDGTNVIASGLPGVEKTEEWHKDRSNTMIGLIRDNACAAYCIYSPDPFALTK